jgi:hypothetical protein
MVMGLALPAWADLDPGDFDVFPYRVVGAYGKNNERDVTSQACDMILGCFDPNGYLCSDNPDQVCELATVPEGRCASASSTNLWPRRAGQCAGTEGYFQKGATLPEAVKYGGIPCLTDEYAQRLKDQDASWLAANEKTDGPSRMCPIGTNQGGSNTTFPDATGVCDMDTNNNRANCQVDDPTGGIDLGEGAGYNTSVFNVCNGTMPRCSDGDPEIKYGGLGTSMCTDLEILGQIDSQVGCGTNGGTPALDSPKNHLENPSFLFTGQRDPGSGFLGEGPIREVRATTAIRIQSQSSADAETLGIRRIAALGKSTWADVVFNSKQATGGLDNIVQIVPCLPPDDWEVQQPVSGNCDHDAGIFCVTDDACGTGNSCINRVYCQEEGAVYETLSFLWTRDIVEDEPIPSGSEAESLGWNTDKSGGNATCPPVCGTAYKHTTFEQEAIDGVGLQDRDSGIQLAFDSLSGRQAGEGDLLGVSATTATVWVNEGDLRCQLGGQDPNDTLNIGTCSLTLTACPSTQFGSDAAPCTGGGVDICVPCGGTHTYHDPVNGNSQALPIGYDDLGVDALKLIKHKRLGLLTEEPTTLQVAIFVAGTTNAAGAISVDNTCSTDRCVLGKATAGDPGSVGIGSGGTYSAGQIFPAGGSNQSGGPVSWSPQDLPTCALDAPCVEVKSFAVGENGIPGCHGANLPENSAAQSCRKRYGRGNTLDGAWGFCNDGASPPKMCESDMCSGGSRAGLPCIESTDCPSGTCSGVAAIYCGAFDCEVALVSGGDWDDPDDWLYEYNTGADDPEIQMDVETVGSPESGHKAKFLVPDPTADAPTLLGVGATTLRDLDIIDEDSADVVVKTNTVTCPINIGTGLPVCAFGGCTDTDSDGHCDGVDNCPYVHNPGQEDTGDGFGNPPDGIGNACQCGDVTGDGTINSADATMIVRKALGLSAPAFNNECNCDVTDVSGDTCNSADATMIIRKALGLSAPAFGNKCGNYTGECTCDSFGNCPAP